jgi:hypothetical protein
MLPTSLSKVTLPKDVLHHLKEMVNKEKTITKPTLFQSKLRGDPLVNEKSCKEPHLKRISNKPNIV